MDLATTFAKLLSTPKIVWRRLQELTLGLRFKNGLEPKLIFFIEKTPSPNFDGSSTMAA